MKNFQMELIVYSEIEEFPQEVTHPNFTYPFSERKHRLNFWRPTATVTKQVVQDVYLRRNIVCLDKKA